MRKIETTKLKSAKFLKGFIKGISHWEFKDLARFHVAVITQINRSVVYFNVWGILKFWVLWMLICVLSLTWNQALEGQMISFDNLPTLLQPYWACGSMIMKRCVQWNLVITEKNSASGRPRSWVCSCRPALKSPSSWGFLHGAKHSHLAGTHKGAFSSRSILNSCWRNIQP